jgi:hypothetical protein
MTLWIKRLMGQRTLSVAVNAKLDGLISFISITADIPRDRLVESLLLAALAGQDVFDRFERELIEETSKDLLGLDLPAFAKKQLSEGVLSPKKPLRRTRGRGTDPHAEDMIVSATFAVRIDALWLPQDPGEIEALRVSLLHHAKDLQATRVHPGTSPAEGDVRVDHIASIGRKDGER